MFERKAEEGLSSFAPEKMPSVYDEHLGQAAYAAIPEAPENKTEKEVEEKDFQLLYRDKKRITSFPKSPNMVSIKLPDGINSTLALYAARES